MGCRNTGGSSQDRKVFGSNEELDAPWLAWLALDEARSFEGENHLMNRRWRDLEVSLHVGLGGWPPHDAGVGVNEREILPLLGGEAGLWAGVTGVGHLVLPCQPERGELADPTGRTWKFFESGTFL